MVLLKCDACRTVDEHIYFQDSNGGYSCPWCNASSYLNADILLKELDSNMDLIKCGFCGEEGTLEEIEKHNCDDNADE